MRRALALAVAACSFAQGQSAIQKDPILRSMRDELQRSRTLAISNLEQPYYLEYTLDDVASFSTSSSLGALVSTTENRFRVPRVRVRVGDYAFDNGNYVFTDFLGGTRFEAEAFPLDDTYAIMRRSWWLATDRAYKSAVELIARKRAALKNISQPEAVPDFAKAEPVQAIDPEIRKQVVPGPWPERIRALSAVFSSYPDVISSVVTFTGSDAMYYMHNSEGTTLRRREPLAHLQAQAYGYAPDGAILRDSVFLAAPEASGMPSEAELRKQLETAGSNIASLIKAPVGEGYNGPVLFEGFAGAQIVAEVLAPHFALGRRPVPEPGRPVSFLPSELEGRVESRVLPEFVDVVDDPSQDKWNGQTLLGHYEIDEEGVRAAPLTLVEKGKLKTYLLTRQPIKTYLTSNGRGRMPGPYGARAASVSNLFVRASESVSQTELKARLIKMIGERSKPYGIIVRKMDFPSSASGDEVRRLMAAAGQSGTVRPVSSPVLVYRVYPDGREELVRGLRFRGLSVRSFRDVVAVSSELTALHYLNNLAPFAMTASGGYVAPVSVIAPSILFDELELEKPQEELQKLPVVQPPALSTSSRS